MTLPDSLRRGLALVLTLMLCTLASGDLAFAQAEPATEAAAATDAGAAADGWDFEEVDEAEPTLAQLAKEQALDIALFAAFAALAMVSFFRKSIPLKYVTLVASVAYMGFYKSQLISVVNIFGVLVGNLPIRFPVGKHPGFDAGKFFPCFPRFHDFHFTSACFPGFIDRQKRRIL